MTARPATERVKMGGADGEGATAWDCGRLARFSTKGGRDARSPNSLFGAEQGIRKRGKTRGGFYLSWRACRCHLDIDIIGLYSYNFIVGMSQDSDIGQRHLSKTKYP
jgi:hypothetical protein